MYLRKLYSNSFPKKLKMMQRKLFTFKFVATRPSFLNSLTVDPGEDVKVEDT